MSDEVVERAAQRMWELHAQEKSWDELLDIEREQMRLEAVEVLTFAGVLPGATDGELMQVLLVPDLFERFKGWLAEHNAYVYPIPGLPEAELPTFGVAPL